MGYSSIEFPYPQHMLTSTLAINVALAFCMGSHVQAPLDSNIGQPMAQIFYQSFGQKGTLAVWSIVVIVQSASRYQPLHNVTNGFGFQVYDGVKHGEYSLHHVTQYSRYETRFWQLRGRHLLSLEMVLSRSPPSCTG